MRPNRYDSRPLIARAKVVLAAAAVIVGGIAAASWPAGAPAVVLAAAIPAAGALVRAWRGAEGTAMRPSVAWGAASVGLAAAGMAAALGEAVDGGRPWAGHLVYLANLALLAALISTFNARRPGNGAWAILMGLLVLVLLIPWLEGIGLARGVGPLARLRLEAPWSWFFALTGLVGAGNYLPTRYGPAAAVAVAGLAVELVGLSVEGLAPSTRAGLWSASAWALLAAPTVAGWRASGARRGGDPPERLWRRFRDHWGVVWGLRVAERFNRAAEGAGWPIRLGWHGIEPAPGRGSRADHVPGTPEEAVGLLKGLVRRFLTPEAADSWASGPPEAADSGASGPIPGGKCPGEGLRS